MSSSTAGHLLCLRSTVAPGTTRFVHKWIERHTRLRVGKEIFLAFCPERIAEGRAYEELHTLPQIIGAEDDESHRRAAELFAHLAPEILPSSYVTAELVKLFNNILRYVHFALANQFAMIADEFGANIYETRRLANYKYPRSFLAAPGMTAGTCLRKDFGMINEWSPYPDMLLSAWKVNEYVPAFLVDHLLQRTEIHDTVVAILGFSFKAETDDVRDSLAAVALRAAPTTYGDPGQRPPPGRSRPGGLGRKPAELADRGSARTTSTSSSWPRTTRDTARRWWSSETSPQRLGRRYLERR